MSCSSQVKNKEVQMKTVLKKFIKKVPPIRKIVKTFDNQKVRDEFVERELEKIPDGKILLDAGCGSQRYRKYCTHLVYKAQDFGQFTVDETPSLTAFKNEYQYGEIDYMGNIWNIDERDEAFDVILCTEVFEHIAYPVETIKEFSRVLKKGGKLILTAPLSCMRHMDPYYFYSGFSDRWYEEVLPKNGLTINKICAEGDYYSWMRAEVGRNLSLGNFWEAMVLFPSFVYFSLKNKTSESAASLCEGYYVVAIKEG